MENQFSQSLEELIENAILFHTSVCESGLVMRKYVKSRVYKPKAAGLVCDSLDVLYHKSVKAHDWCLSAKVNHRHSVGEEEIYALKMLFSDFKKNHDDSEFLMTQLPDAPALAHKNFQKRALFLEEMNEALDGIIAAQNRAA